MLQVNENRERKSEDKAVKVETWTYRYIKKLSSERGRNMKDTLKQICREHRERTAPALERAIGKIDDAMDEVDGENRRYLSLCKLGLRRVSEGDNQIIGVLNDVVKQTDRVEKMIEADRSEEKTSEEE